jgi:hypothetical protein
MQIRLDKAVEQNVVGPIDAVKVPRKPPPAHKDTEEEKILKRLNAKNKA